MPFPCDESSPTRFCLMLQQTDGNLVLSVELYDVTVGIVVSNGWEGGVPGSENWVQELEGPINANLVYF